MLDYTRRSVMSLLSAQLMPPWHLLHLILVMRMIIRLGTLLTMRARRSLCLSIQFRCLLMTMSGLLLQLWLQRWRLIPLHLLRHIIVQVVLIVRFTMMLTLVVITIMELMVTAIRSNTMKASSSR